MGLHLNFELRLRAGTLDDEVRSKLVALREYATTVPLRRVGPVVATRPERWGVPEHDTQRALELLASLIAEPWEDELVPLTGDRESAIGFLVDPGQGSETAIFGLFERSDGVGVARDWWWWCACKTQYASTVSDAHLVTCHSALVAVLDRAIAIGFEVTVHDETGYWEHRDPAKLISEVTAMNRIIAGFAGQLSDALTRQDGRPRLVEAPIFEHPRFERLEMGEE
jgi:hypothetical protein